MAEQILFDSLKGWEAYAQLRAAAEKAQVSAAHGMAEGQKPYLAAALHRDTRRPVVLVVPNDVIAARMAEDLTQLLGETVGLLPAREVSLYRAVAASQEVSSRRLEALQHMSSGAVGVLVASADALMHRLMEPAVFAAHAFTLEEGQRCALDALSERLTACGYTREDMVEGKGQFALRGGILDEYAPAAISALRIEFFDDEVDSIRTFDVLTQRSQNRVQRAEISPASEALIPDRKSVV